jgi:dephospho-CoA kinase
VKQAWAVWLKEREEEGRVAGAVVMVPLLYEVGEERGWDAVVCVSAGEVVQLGRLKERGFSEAEGRRRISAQMAVGEKMARADYVILNHGTKELLREQTRRVWAHILETRYGR